MRMDAAQIPRLSNSFETEVGSPLRVDHVTTDALKLEQNAGGCESNITDAIRISISSSSCCCPFLHGSDSHSRNLMVIESKRENQTPPRVPLPEPQYSRSDSMPWTPTHFTTPTATGNGIPGSPLSLSSLTAWSCLDHGVRCIWIGLEEGRWRNLRQRRPSDPATLSRQQSHQNLFRASDRKRWDALWRDTRPPDIAYNFKHYADTRRYIEQYRHDHTYKQYASAKPQNEFPIPYAPPAAPPHPHPHLLHPQPPLFSFPPHLERFHTEAGRYSPADVTLRLSYHHQPPQPSCSLDPPTGRMLSDEDGSPLGKIQLPRLESPGFFVDDVEEEGGEKASIDRLPSQSTSSNSSYSGAPGGINKYRLSLAKCVLKFEGRHGNRFLPGSVQKSSTSGSLKEKHRPVFVTATLKPRQSCASQNLAGAVSLEIDRTRLLPPDAKSLLPHPAKADATCISSSSRQVVAFGSTSTSAHHRKSHPTTSGDVDETSKDAMSIVQQRQQQQQRLPTTTFVAINDLVLTPSRGSRRPTAALATAPSAATIYSPVKDRGPRGLLVRRRSLDMAVSAKRVLGPQHSTTVVCLAPSTVRRTKAI